MELDSIILDSQNDVTYRLSGKLGEGGFGIVYKAISDDTPPKTVAIKMLKDSELQSYNAFKETGLMQLIKNSVICSRYIACLHSTFSFNDKEIFVYDYVPGQDLINIILNKSVEERFANYGGLAVALNTCKGLDYIHRLGIYHQDIKPGNMMYDTRDGLAKFVDWGSACGAPALAHYFSGDTKEAIEYRQSIEFNIGACFFEDDLAKSHADDMCNFTGTHSYSSPELMTVLNPEIFASFHNDENVVHPWRNDPFASFLFTSATDLHQNNIGKAHDIWSLGCVLLEWYTNINFTNIRSLTPRSTPSFQHYYMLFTYSDIAEKILSLIRDVPLLNVIVPLMLENNPNIRLENWSQVMTIINNFCESSENIGCPTVEQNTEITEKINTFLPTAVAEIQPFYLN